MKGEIKSFTQIYDVVGLSVSVIEIVVFLYDVNLVKSCQYPSAFLVIVGGKIVKVHFHVLWKAMG